MIGWHHRFNGHEFEQTLGDSEGQGSLACCSSWGCKESDMTEQLNWEGWGGQSAHHRHLCRMLGRKQGEVGELQGKAWAALGALFA